MPPPHPMYAQFRMSLSKALSEATGHFDIVTSDTRIGPLLKVLIVATMYSILISYLFFFMNCFLNMTNNSSFTCTSHTPYVLLFLFFPISLEHEQTVCR